MCDGLQARHGPKVGPAQDGVVVPLIVDPVQLIDKVREAGVGGVVAVEAAVADEYAVVKG